MSYVTTKDGVEIFYKDWGPKGAQPIVFHHGWPLSGDDWDAQMLFFMHQVNPAKIETGARHPRERADWPLVGIFSQRGKARPNRIGLTRAAIVKVDGRVLTVRGLDAIDGTPVLDVKPWMDEFAPIGATRQPEWASELMRDYFKA